MKIFDQIMPHRAIRGALGRYAAEVWAEDPRHVAAFYDSTHAALQTASSSDLRSADPRESSAHADGVARIPIVGQILPSVPPIFDALSFMGVEATGVDDVRDAIMLALDDDAVTSIELAIDSPGGAVSGVEALGQLIAKATESKPVIARGSGMVASAAYWLASQASEFTVEPGTAVGSIGVYTTVEDSSAMHAAHGVQVHAVRSGEHKGVGEEGVPVSDAQIAELQHHVDTIAAAFIGAVASGRGQTIESIAAVADGRVFSPSEAIDLGLIDGITTTPLEARDIAREVQSMELTEKLEAALSRIAALEENHEKASADNAQLAIRLAEAEAKEAAAQASLLGVEQSRKAAIIDQGVADGRIVPAGRAHVEKYAETASADDLASFVASLAVAVRRQAQGSATVASVGDDASDEEKKIARMFGVSIAQMRSMSNVKGVGVDGLLVTNDGRRVKTWGEVN